MGYILGEPTVQQYFDANGDPLENGTIEFFIWNTSTPTAIYSDSTGTSAGTSVTLNSIGAPANGGTSIALFFDTTVIYKIVRKDSAGSAIAPTIGPYFPTGASNEVDAVSVSASDSLYTRTGIVNGEQVSVGGFYVPSDGGGGMFCWDSLSTAADEGGIVILPTGHVGAGRWVRAAVVEHSVKWFGAKGDGATNDTAAFQAAWDAVADKGTIYVPAGDNYIISVGSLNFGTKWAKWSVQGSQMNGSRDWNNMGGIVDQMFDNRLLVISADPRDAISKDLNSVIQYIRRLDYTSQPTVNGNNQKIITANGTIDAGVGDGLGPYPEVRHWLVSAEGINESPNAELVGLSSVVRKPGAAAGTFAGHFQVISEDDATTVQSMIGIECNLILGGPDTGTNRYGIDVVAKSRSGGTGVGTAGIRIRNNNASSGGRWSTALVIDDGYVPLKEGIQIKNSGGAGGFGISDTGTKDYGIKLEGTYAGAAISLTAGHKIDFDETSANGASISFNATNDHLEFYMGGTLRAWVDMAKIGGGQMN